METTTQPQVDVETNAQPEANQEQTQETTETTPFLKVKHLKEEKGLSQEDAVAYAQKGMDYDRVKEQLKIRDKELAKYRQQEAQNEIDKKATEFAEANDVKPEIAKQMISDQAELAQLKQKAQIDNQINKFTKAHPEVNLATIPDEVFETAKENNIELLTAYDAYESQNLRAEVQKLKTQLGVNKANAENAESSMGSASSAGDATPTKLTEESIKAMTRAQRQKMMPRILEWLDKQKK